jgi:hypothetical protein
MRDNNALHLTVGLAFTRPQVNANVSPMGLISSP